MTRDSRPAVLFGPPLKTRVQMVEGARLCKPRLNGCNQLIFLLPLPP
jgi:hypothetical protein